MICYFDRDGFDVICYASNVAEDDVTEALRGSATEWRACSRLGHEQLAHLIRDDAIDILVDLSGHSAGNRLSVFARKPAPVQVHAWGFATGTGLSTMDYFLTDPVVVPEEERDSMRKASATCRVTFPTCRLIRVRTLLRDLPNATDL